MPICPISVHSFLLGSLALRMCPIKSNEYACRKENFATTAKFFSSILFSFSPRVCFQSTNKDSGVARGWRRGRPAPGVTILAWHHITMWNYNSTDLLWIPSFFTLFGPCPDFAAKTFFLSSPIFGPKKGATTKSHPGCHILSNATESLVTL